MAYIVNNTVGTVVATIADGTIDTTSSSITLLGKGFNNYGEIVAEAEQAILALKREIFQAQPHLQMQYAANYGLIL